MYHKMFTCIILDDDIFATTYLRRLINDRIDLKLLRTFTQPSKALEYLNSSNVDIIFLDIYLPEILGTSVAKLIQKGCGIIFTTVSDKEALEAFNVHAIDYLLKPINTDRFNLAIDKAKILLQQKEMVLPDTNTNEHKKTITIISDRKIYKVTSQDIVYIESLFEYVCYYTKKTKLLSLGALKDVTNELPTNEFIRIHKSYIINIRHLNNYSAVKVMLSNGTELPIGRVYKDDFKAAISKFYK